MSGRWQQLIRPVKQRTDWSCGPAALRGALHALGVDATEAELAKISGTTAVAGTSASGLAAAARQVGADAGVKAKIEYGLTMEELDDILFRGRAVLLLVQSGPFQTRTSTRFDASHWVALCSISGEAPRRQVELMDPSKGLPRPIISEKELMVRWHGMDEGSETHGLALVLSTASGAAEGVVLLPRTVMS